MLNFKTETAAFFRNFVGAPSVILNDSASSPRLVPEKFARLGFKIGRADETAAFFRNFVGAPSVMLNDSASSPRRLPEKFARLGFKIGRADETAAFFRNFVGAPSVILNDSASSPLKNKQVSVTQKSGQAIVELLPSIILFLMVMTAGLSYFRTMREATIRQEVVRNVAFAKISNSGTLTTPLGQASGEAISYEGSNQNIGIDAIPGARNEPVFVSADNNPTCFVVTPEQVQKTLEAGNAVGVGPLAPVSITTYAVVQRYPGGRCP